MNNDCNLCVPVSVNVLCEFIGFVSIGLVILCCPSLTELEVEIEAFWGYNENHTREVLIKNYMSIFSHLMGLVLQSKHTFRKKFLSRT